MLSFFIDARVSGNARLMQLDAETFDFMYTAEKHLLAVCMRISV